MKEHAFLSVGLGQQNELESKAIINERAKRVIGQQFVLKKMPLNATIETPNIILRAILCSIQNNGKEMISILPHIIIQNDHRDHKNIYIIQSGRPEINYTLTPFLQETSDSETSPQVSMVGVAIAS